MKKLFLPAALITALFMASCSDDAMEAAIGSAAAIPSDSAAAPLQKSEGIFVTINASINGSESVSKTCFDDDLKYQFSGGEELALFSSKNLSTPDKLENGSNGGKTATFSGTIYTETAENYYGVVPYSAAKGVDEAGKIAFTLLQSQTVDEDQFDPAAHIIAAKSNNYENLEFYTANAFLQVKIPSTETRTFTEITMTSNAGEKISGNAIYDPENKTVAAASDANNSVTISGTFSPGKSYFISLLPCTLSKGFNLVATDNQGNSCKLNYTEQVTFGRNEYKGINLTGLKKMLKVSLDDLGFATNVPKSKATKVVFDTKSNVEDAGVILPDPILVKDNQIGIYCVNGTEYYILSENDDEICMTGSLENMFGAHTKVTSIELKNFNTAEVTDMNCMFYYCSKLASLNLGDNFNTAEVTDMTDMFFYCYKLVSLALGDNFNTAKVTSMQGMFFNCLNLASLALGNNFNTAKVTDMASMFNGCSALKSLDLGDNFNTAKVTDMRYMFKSCTNLATIKVKEGFTLKLFGLSSDDMFTGCESLVGGEGTTYSSSNVTAKYACIDGGPASPGYFTKR